MKKNKKLILAGAAILLGGMCMRIAWVIINRNLATVIVITGAILFLGGVIIFANTVFNRRGKF